MSDRVTTMVADGVAEVTLSRPAKCNALDPAMFEAISAAGNRLVSDPSIRAVVLCGAGEHFCAGIDTGAFDAGSSPVSRERMRPVPGSPANFYQSTAYVWSTVPVPVIAALQGIVYGGGLQIAAGADIRYASADARLSVMEVRWGLIPDMAITHSLRNVIALDQLKELTFSGKIVSGAEAAEIGLVTRVVDDPLTAARALAREIASKSPDAVRYAKRLFNEAWAMPSERSLRLEAELQTEILSKPNQREAARANLEKRLPAFKDPV